MSKLRSTLRRWLDKLVLPFLLTLFITGFIVAYFYHSIFISVSPGHVGAKWKRFAGGIDVDTVYQEGFHLNWPWDILKVFDTRVSIESRTVNVLSSDSLHMDLDVSVRYRLNPHTAALLYKNVKSNYVDVLLMPEVQSHSLSTFAKYRSEEIYSIDRDKVQADILAAVVEGIQLKTSQDGGRTEPFIYVQDILIKSITLPEAVRESIEQKSTQRHLMLSYEHRLEREKLESLRKEIEALGIRKFQDTVRDGISDRYLRWKGIDATLALASSHNTKVVVIGAGDEGLPLILGNMGSEDTPPQNAEDAGSSRESTRTLTEEMDKVTDQTLNSLLFDSQNNQTPPANQLPEASPEPQTENVKN